MERTRVIFVGPSLYGCQVDYQPEERWIPPARCGDILETCRQNKPSQIVLIDGVFYQDLAVWHKEILYALLQGVTVIGAASMGALRAAELDRYGMIGIGKIYQMYREGEEDDSLVMVTFDPETFQVLSPSPIGNAQKTEDALAAIRFARSYTGVPDTGIDPESIKRYIEIVTDRIWQMTPTQPTSRHPFQMSV
jgi:hypothetical protein